MSSNVNGYEDGERVFHRLWQTTGTVRVVNDDTAEVAWDGAGHRRRADRCIGAASGEGGDAVTGRHTEAETIYLYGPTGQVTTITIAPGSQVASIDGPVLPTVRAVGQELDAYIAEHLANGWSLT